MLEVEYCFKYKWIACYIRWNNNINNLSSICLKKAIWDNGGYKKSITPTYNWFMLRLLIFYITSFWKLLTNKNVNNVGHWLVLWLTTSMKDVLVCLGIRAMLVSFLI